MKFDESNIIEVLSKSWSWKIPEVMSVLAVNSMGNCFLKDSNGHYWRVCPEELSAEIVARTEDEVQEVFSDPEYKQDWQLLGLIDPAEEQLGALDYGECYCMLKPAVIGGEYEVSNLRIGSIYEYLSLSGELAFKTKDLKSGDKIEIYFE